MPKKSNVVHHLTHINSSSGITIHELSRLKIAEKNFTQELSKISLRVGKTANDDNDDVNLRLWRCQFLSHSCVARLRANWAENSRINFTFAPFFHHFSTFGILHVILKSSSASKSTQPQNTTFIGKLHCGGCDECRSSGWENKWNSSPLSGFSRRKSSIRCEWDTSGEVFGVLLTATRDLLSFLLPH